MLNVLQVLIFRDTNGARELFPTLWAAFQEVDKLYNYDERRLECQRWIVDLDNQPSAVQELLVPSIPAPSLAAAKFWSAAQGKFHRTIDQKRLAELVRLQLPQDRRDSHLLVVTDREITPPPDWRYIIWDRESDSAVVSTAPCDPEYWRERTRDRIAVIKHRVRTACLTITGGWLGLSRCQNPSCFLFEGVDAADTLDEMIAFGEEHGIVPLTGLGFSPRPRQPSAVQSLDPAPKCETALPEADLSEWSTYE